MSTVVIIGAGPGGLACATYLAQNSSHKVMVLERRSIIGPKVCGGGLSSINKEFVFPEEKLLSFSNQCFNVNNRAYNILLQSPLRTISRYDLGQYQLKQAKEAGVEIITDCTVGHIGDAFLLTNKGRVPFDTLVGADGALSVVRKHLGLPSQHYESFHYLVEQQHDEMEWLFSPKELGAGYAWIFPHQGYTSVGVYMNPAKTNMAVAKEYLNTLVEKRFAGKPKKFEGFVVNTSYNGVVFDDIFLVGDAAGLVSAATGEGIGFALRSGVEVAKKIIEPTYAMSDLKRIVEIKQRQDRFVKVAEKLPIGQALCFHAFAGLMKYPFYQNYFGN